MSSRSKPELVVGTSISIGDGNPASLYALEATHRRTVDTPFHTVTLHRLPHIAGYGHALMTKSDHARTEYLKHGEELRSSWAGKLFGYALYLNFLYHLRHIPEIQAGTPYTWKVVQEHMLLGVPQRLTEQRNPIELYVPDVRPKQSALLANMRLPQSTLMVWNDETYQDLRQKGYTVKRVHPFLLDGFSPDPESFMHKGVPIVIKTSGSGMPAHALAALTRELTAQQRDWVIHTPQGKTQCLEGITHTERIPDKKGRISAFFDTLGAQTQILISYPNELVQVMYEMQLRGATHTDFFVLPPRGEHELNNLMFGWNHGLIKGLCVTSPHEAIPPTQLPDLPIYTPSQIFG